jgi:hypothetical protein
MGAEQKNHSFIFIGDDFKTDRRKIEKCYARFAGTIEINGGDNQEFITVV